MGNSKDKADINFYSEGSIPLQDPTFHLILWTVEITVAAHDTTGGMMTKISEAAMIAKLGIDVYIVKAKTFTSISIFLSLAI